MKGKLPRCKCGEGFGLWFCERLNRYVCPVCLDREVVSLKAVKAKPWDVELEVWQDGAVWYWEFVNNYHPAITCYSRKRHYNEDDARDEAHRVIERLNLVECKAKAGKE